AGDEVSIVLEASRHTSPSPTRASPSASACRPAALPSTPEDSTQRRPITVLGSPPDGSSAFASPRALGQQRELLVGEAERIPCVRVHLRARTRCPPHAQRFEERDPPRSLRGWTPSNSTPVSSTARSVAPARVVRRIVEDTMSKAQ